jgi:flagellin-like protein
MRKMRANVRKSRKRGVSPIIATILLVAITVVLAAVLYVLVSGYLGSTGAKPSSLGMAGGLATTTTCGTTAGALYFESVSITSTSSTITTTTLGLKIIPAAGGLAFGNGNTIAAASACPAAGGYFVGLVSAAGTTLACWVGQTVASSPVWSTLSGSSCVTTTTAAATTLGTAQTITGGETLVVYMYGTSNSNTVPPMSGAYTMQAYGLSGATVSGSVDL